MAWRGAINTSFSSSVWERTVAKLRFASGCEVVGEAELSTLCSQVELGNEGVASLFVSSFPNSAWERMAAKLGFTVRSGDGTTNGEPPTGTLNSRLWTG